MGVIETVKDIGVLVQKLDNMDLVKRLVELQEQVYEVVTENRNLKEHNRALLDKMATREQLTFNKNAYWKGEDGPFCSRCWDAESLLVRIHRRGRYTPQCPKCQTYSVDPEERPEVPVDVGRKSPWS